MEHREERTTANLTLSVDEDVLRTARIRALEQGTSVNALVRAYLEAFAGRSRDKEAMEAFLRLTERSRASSGPDGRSWRRQDLYKRRGR